MVILLILNKGRYYLFLFQDTPESINYLSTLDETAIVFEGYEEFPTNRKGINFMNSKTDGHIVKLDGVGGTLLLVRGDIHREGAIFPPFGYQHTMETEG
jgi:mannan polymerase complexes MNN9 subunit